MSLAGTVYYMVCTPSVLNFRAFATAELTIRDQHAVQLRATPLESMNIEIRSGVQSPGVKSVLSFW